MEAIAIDRRSVTEVADTFVALMRSFGRAKARFLAAAEHDMEWSAQILLRHLATYGPMRAGELAESMHSDPSTVSRQVAALVKDGLIERRADPDDGRASILVPTTKADVILETQERLREEHFAAMLKDWSETDLNRFSALLRQFTTDFENSSTTMLSERAHSQRSAEGKK
jgi:DNA-binding MarR family transcriptional regulator